MLFLLNVLKDKTMALTPLFDALCEILDPKYSIEANAIKTLRDVEADIDLPQQTAPLDQVFLNVMPRLMPPHLSLDRVYAI